MASAHGQRVGATWGAGLLQDNQGKVLGELGQGYDASQGYLGQAGDVYKGMAAQGQQGLDKYNGLTLGSGQDIQKALEGTGGYQFNLGQGLQAIQRNRAAQGMLGSGNADTDAMTFASGLASNTLNSERQALSPYLSMYQQGVGGQAGVLGSQAGLATDYYGNRASVLDDTTKNIVGLGTQALKAGDQAKSANQSMMMGAAQAGLGLLSGGLGGGFTSLFGGTGAISNGLGAMTGFSPFARNM